MRGDIDALFADYGPGVHSGAFVTVDLDAASMAVPPDAARVELTRLLPTWLASRVAFPSDFLLRKVPLVAPCASVCVREGQYDLIIDKLEAAGMISFTRSPIVINGLFGATKPDGSVRLIIDARPANAWFRQPPSVSLPSPEVFSHFLPSTNSEFLVAKSDLDNYYHRLRLPEWLAFLRAPPGN